MEEEIKLAPIKTALLNLTTNFDSLGRDITDFIDDVNKRFENIKENQRIIKEGLEEIKDEEKKKQLKEMVEIVDKFRDRWTELKDDLSSYVFSCKAFSFELSERYKKLFGETY